MITKDMIENKGDDLFIGRYVEISRPHLVKIGSHVAIDSFFFCTTAMELGDYIHIAPSVSVIGGGNSHFKMGNFTFLAAGSRVICGSEDYNAGGLFGATIPSAFKAPIKHAPVEIQDFAGLGTNTVIMPGVTMAIGSMTGAGAVVTKSTEPWGLYLGAPAKLVRMKSPENIAKTLEYARKLGYNY